MFEKQHGSSAHCTRSKRWLAALRDSTAFKIGQSRPDRTCQRMEESRSIRLCRSGSPLVPTDSNADYRQCAIETIETYPASPWMCEMAAYVRQDDLTAALMAGKSMRCRRIATATVSRPLVKAPAHLGESRQMRQLE